MGLKEGMKTDELLDEEKKAAVERRLKLSSIAIEIEKIFLDADMNMGEFLEIMELFTRRANAVFSETKIKTIKEKYEV